MADWASRGSAIWASHSTGSRLEVTMVDAAWWSDFRSRVAFTKPADESLLMMLGISACFSADPDGTPRLPFDPHNGVLDQGIWERWLDWDPVRMVPRHADALRSLRAIWIDG